MGGASKSDGGLHSVGSDLSSVTLVDPDVLSVTNLEGELGVGLIDE